MVVIWIWKPEECLGLRYNHHHGLGRYPAHGLNAPLRTFPLTSHVHERINGFSENSLAPVRLIDPAFSQSEKCICERHWSKYTGIENDAGPTRHR